MLHAVSTKRAKLSVKFRHGVFSVAQSVPKLCCSIVTHGRHPMLKACTSANSVPSEFSKERDPGRSTRTRPFLPFLRRRTENCAERPKFLTALGVQILNNFSVQILNNFCQYRICLHIFPCRLHTWAGKHARQSPTCASECPSERCILIHILKNPTPGSSLWETTFGRRNADGVGSRGI